MKATMRVLFAALLIGCLAFVAIPAGAQTTPTMSVTPDAGLVDGDVVTLVGSGFTATGGVGFCQGIVREPQNPGNCDGWPSLGRVGLDTVNAAGEFSAQYIVRRFMSISGVGKVDCAQLSARCVIHAGNVLGTSTVGPVVTVPITFTPLPPPSVTITPDTGLVDSDVVTLDGSGFNPSRRVDICQSVSADSIACDAPSQSVVADDAGEFSAQHTVRRFISASPFGVPTTDCAAPSATCAIGIADYIQPGPTGVAPITFAPQPPPPGQIFGTVTDPEGDPVAGADVWAYTDTDGFVGSLRTTTDTQGMYAFTDAEVETGVSYRILFRHPSGSSLTSQWFRDSPTRTFAIAITLSSGELAKADAQLGEEGTISGSVTDANGDPVAGVAVRAFLSPDDRWVATHVTTTGPDGNYLIRNVQLGRFYEVQFVPAAASGLAAEWWNDAPTRRSADVIDGLTAGATVTGVDAQLEQAGVISGSVTGPNGNAVAGVSVWAFGPDDGRVGSYLTSTAADGSYSIERVRPEQYLLLFLPPAGSGLAAEWYDNATRASAQTITVTAGQTTTGVNAQLAASP